jgi:hypothetical protein
VSGQNEDVNLQNVYCKPTGLPALLTHTNLHQPSSPEKYWIVNTDRVSGFYGPGTYLAWLLSALSIMIKLDQNGRFTSLNLEDAAVLVYPMVASVDLWKRMIYFFPGNLDASFYAAGLVGSNGWVLTFLALAVQRRREQLLPRQDSELARQPEPLKAPEGRRNVSARGFLVLACALLLSSTILHLLSVEFRVSSIRELKDHRNFTYPAVFYIPLGVVYSLRTGLWSSSMLIIMVLCLEGLVHKTPILPPSGAKLTDLDQMTVLVFSVFVFLLRLGPGLYEAFKRAVTVVVGRYWTSDGALSTGV